MYLLLLLLFTLTANRFLPGGSGTTIRHNTQITHTTQNNTALKQNITQIYTNNEGHTTHNEYNAIQLQLQQIQLQLQLIKK
jgi:hypothetical protein